MTRKFALAAGSLLFACLGLTASPAFATPEMWELDATTTLPTAIGSFSVDFTDSDGNGLLDLGELTSFSGVHFSNAGLPIDFTVLTGSPDLAGFSVAGGVDVTLGMTSDWWFDVAGGGAGRGFGAGTWTYQLVDLGPSAEPGTGTVPEPASMALVGLALGGLALARRRRG